MRTALLQSVGDHLAANPASPFVQAIGGIESLRYWPWEAGQREPYPYAVSFIISEVDVGAMMVGISAFEWQMNIYAESLSEVNRLASQCRGLFSEAQLPLPGGCHTTCLYETTYGPLRMAVEDPFQITVTFSCHI